MGHNKSCAKSDFSWAQYMKRLRHLPSAQEAALLGGPLEPLLDYARTNRDVRFDIRPGKANVYYDGGNLLRLEGAAPTRFKGVFDLGYAGDSGLRTFDMTTTAGVKAVVNGFGDCRNQMFEHRHAGNGRDERRYEQHIARANDARPGEPAGDYVIFDIEYSYARRCFDFVLFDLGELPEPRLIFGELKCRPGALNGSAGLREHGRDFGDFLNAEGGRHVDIAKSELAGIVKQKQRLGLLSADVRFDSFSLAPPEFLVVFADYDVRSKQLQTPLERLHEEVTNRMGNTELLRFAHFDEVDDGSTDTLRLRRENIMSASEFAEYREAD